MAACKSATPPAEENLPTAEMAAAAAITRCSDSKRSIRTFCTLNADEHSFRAASVRRESEHDATSPRLPHTDGVEDHLLAGRKDRVGRPERVAGLVLFRPAWPEHSQAERNVAAYELIADLLEQHETDEALRRLIASQLYRGAVEESESAAQSLRHQITRPRAAINTQVLHRFPTGAPSRSREDWANIAVPTLVIAHHDDPFHPWHIAKSYAEAIPQARLVEVTSKDRNPDAFMGEVDAAISGFVDGTEWKSA